MNGVPTPLALPFAIFPDSDKHTSGVIIPTYGESQAQGFYLRNGGFYWSINDYLDWRITGDIYTRGDWSLNNNIQYSKRYKFNGNFSMNYGLVQYGEKETEDYKKTKSMRVTWQHAQDPKANQNSSFSANVNYFNTASQQYSPSINDHFNNQSTSNIAYQLRIANRYNLSVTAGLDYNTGSRFINANLPTISFSMDPIYPFKRKVRKGQAKWYESFKINYSMNATNQMSAPDSIFWTAEMLKNMKNGIRHNIPLSMDIKLFKGKLNWNHSANYTEYWYFNTITKGLDSNYQSAIIERNQGFATTRNYNYSTGFSTTLYGLLQFKRGIFRAFRHVMTPSAGFSISPDFYTYASGYRYYEDTLGFSHRYNIFEGNPYGMPSGGKSGSLNFSIGNSFEMKVRNRKDTVEGTRKIKLLESLSLSTSYNLAADSLNWAPITLSARTMLFNTISINYRAQFDLYAKDSMGNPYNKFLWETDRKLFRRESDNATLSVSWSPTSKNSSDEKKPPSKKTADQSEIFEQPAAFNIPWRFSVGYTISYGSNYRPGYYKTNIFGKEISEEIFRKYNSRISQTLTFSGGIDLTQNWKIDFFSGYDFETRKLGLTQFNITRDLHCWTMSFNWTPFGYLKEWGFSIRLKSGMLSDALKYDKRKSFMDGDYN